MKSSAETTNTRCDLHPTQMANWYCGTCCKSLCERCTKMGPNGRLCLNCKVQCREISSLSFERVTAIRQKDQEEQRLAKALIARQREKLEKERVERESRLKSRIEARKSELINNLQRESPTPFEQAAVETPPEFTPPPISNRPASPFAVPMLSPEEAKDFELRLKDSIVREKTDRETRIRPGGPISRRTALAPKLREPSDPAMAPINPMPRPSESRMPDMAPEPLEYPREAPPPSGMYNPHAPNPANEVNPEDPLKRLGERAHLKAVWNASSVMLVAGILLGVSYYIMTYWVADAESEQTKAAIELRAKALDTIQKKIAQTDVPSEKEILGRQLEETNASAPIISPQMTTLYYVRLICYASIAMGVLMVALSFMCERHPLYSMSTALVLYVLLNVAVMFVRVDIIELVCRWSIVIPLFRGTAAAYRLHQYRLTHAN